MSFQVPNLHRVRHGQLASDDSYGNNGLFLIPEAGVLSAALNVIASDGEGWDHVSVRAKGLQRTPTWEEMHRVRQMFWGAQDCVVQFHPPQSEYVNCHPFVLHLWRPQNYAIATPPSWMVGPR